MFENIGKKIKNLAKVLCYLEIAAYIIAAIIIFAIASEMSYGAEWLIGIGFALLIVGPFVSWIGSFFMYGFGELIDNSQIIKETLNNSRREKCGFKNLKVIQTETDTFTGDCEVCQKGKMVLRNCNVNDGVKTQNMKLCEHCISELGGQIHNNQKNENFLSPISLHTVSQEADINLKQCLTCGRMIPVEEKICKCGETNFNK